MPTGVDADSLAGLSCAEGKAVTFASGAWACGTVASSSGNSNAVTNVLTTVASSIASEQNVVMQIGVDGLPLIVYYDLNTRRLNSIHCSTSDCSASVKTEHTSAGKAGDYLDMAIGANGRAVISLYDNTINTDQAVEFNLKVARCADIPCTSSTIVTVDETAAAGQYNSIAIRPNGMPVITYRDFTNGQLKFAFCNDAACVTSDQTVVDSINDPTHIEVIIGFDDLPLIAFRNAVSRSLHVVHCTNEKCTASTDTVADAASNTGEYVSLMVGSDGYVSMAYFDGPSDSLKVLHCSTLECAASTTTVADNSGSSGQWPTINHSCRKRRQSYDFL